jgi:hypothetical protein
VSRLKRLGTPAGITLAVWAVLAVFIVLVLKPSMRDSFISGSEVSRDVLTQCERGHGPCDTALREANDRLRPMGLRIFEDGSVVQER